ncbi:hypothetical protein N005_26790 [Pseudomonas mediterranea CFBP 5447]|nr:hypothetical protein N005_26790 [Pseudomonas mediterranea CFBP 5447]
MFERSLSGLPIGEIQASAGESTLLFNINLLESGFDKLAPSGHDGVQIALAGAIASHSELDLFFSQREQTALGSMDGAIQALIVGHLIF